MARLMDLETVLEQAQSALHSPQPPSLFTADELILLASAVGGLLPSGGQLPSRKRVLTSVGRRLKEVMDGEFCWRVVLRLLRDHREMDDEAIACCCQAFMVEPEQVVMMALGAEWHPVWRSGEEEALVSPLLDASQWIGEDLEPYRRFLEERGQLAAVSNVAEAQAILGSMREKALLG